MPAMAAAANTKGPGASRAGGLLVRGRWVLAVSLGSAAVWSAAAPGEITEAPLAPRPVSGGPTRFIELPPGQTGVVTTNDYADPKMWWELNHEFENGAIGTGVAIGDYDGDGRPDIFVASKTESCRLFRNLGDYRFEDVTEKAGVGDPGAAARIWKQGATFVDVNNDGALDIYVCRFNAPNLLYLNQRDGTFREMGHAYGLDVKDACSMAAFCDYDRDGWLDVFVSVNLLNYSAHPFGQCGYLFHNNRNGTFSDVTAQAGIAGEAQTHSAMWWDYDNDGWPDLYVSSDFSPPDRLYHNNRDGMFTNVIDRVVPHTPFSSMGADLGDVNNDGLIDLLVTDMATTTHEKDQRQMVNSRILAGDPPEGSSAAPQIYHSCLYLNTGTGRCMEAAFLAGVAATDWTWSPRFEDLDNDGRLDLFVTNGMYREANNADLLARQMTAESPAERVRIMRDSPVLSERHLAFRNLGNLQFQDVSRQWGLDQRGVSFGSALGDLSGDGNLDIVYGSYQAGATLLRNNCSTGHRVTVALRGTVSNRFGVGATVRLESAAGSQVRQLVLARGYQSSSEPIVHFGLGGDALIKRLTVEWPSGLRQIFTDLAVDRRFTITEPSGPAPVLARAEPKPHPGQFAEVGQAMGLALVSREEPVDEIAVQRLLPVRLNRRGPGIAVGDIIGDGREDVVLGGTTVTPARILLRASTGGFTGGEAPAVLPAGAVDDGPVLLFDATGRGRSDLFVTRGGNSLPAGSREYQPALLVNDGRGGFQAAPAGALPSLPISVGAVAAADFDHDGRLDLFVGGRVTPGQYPLPPRSALLANRGGRFEDVTDALAPGLRDAGMVTAALWSDVDGDGWVDLLVALEWGHVRFFHNRRGQGFEDWTERAGFAAAGTGWWTSLAAADFNGDGRLDYVAGNVGLNTQYHADSNHPALLFYGDFNGEGGEPQIVEAYYEGDRQYPWRSRLDLGASIPSVLRRYSRSNNYARATLGEILGAERLAAAQRFAATELQSGVFLSQPRRSGAGQPDGTYRFEPLPRLAQIAPLQGVVAADLDGDGCADIYAVQNSYAPIPAVGRFDGGLGQLLRGDGQGHFTPVPAAESGLLVPGDAKALALLDLDQDGWPDFLISRNNDTALAFRNNGVPGRRSLRIQLRGAAGNPTAVGARVTLELADGSSQSSEVHAGSGYYSQSSSACFFGWPDGNPPRELRVRWPDGHSSNQAIPPEAARITVAP